MMRGVSATPLVVLAVAVGVAVCTPIPNDPNTPFSIQVDTVPAPSVVAGDTMRDTTGTVQPIRVEVRNIQGHLITTAPVRFISFDTAQLRFDTVGHAMGTPRGADNPADAAGRAATRSPPLRRQRLHPDHDARARREP